MPGLAYRDNVYQDQAALGGFMGFNANALQAVAAHRQRQQQMAQQAALEQAYLNLAREKQVGEMGKTQADIGLMGAQTRSADAQTNVHKQQLEQAQKDMTQGSNAQEIGATAAALNNPAFANNPEMLMRAITAQRQAGTMPQGQFDIQVPQRPQMGAQPEPTPGLFPGITDQQQQESAQQQQAAQPQDMSALVDVIRALANPAMHSIYAGQAATNPSSSAQQLIPEITRPGDVAYDRVTGQEQFRGPPMVDKEQQAFGHRLEIQKNQQRYQTQVMAIKAFNSTIAQLDAQLRTKKITPTQHKSAVESAKKQYHVGEDGMPTLMNPNNQPQGQLQGQQQDDQPGNTEESKAQYALRHGAPVEAVKARYKQNTGKDLITN